MAQSQDLSPDEERSGRAGNARFQILSLDGGGFKGMFPAAVLACLEADLGISLLDHFDLITGTSTGGIIALGIGLGLRPKRIANFYVEHGPGIFTRRRALAARGLWRAKYSAAPLQAALDEILGDAKLGESRVPLVIPAYDLCTDDTYIFRTPHADRLQRDKRERMVDVALATSAAPTYLPAHRLRGLRLIDGGVWANNPTVVGITEAVGTFGRALSEIRVFSLGTTRDTKARARRLDRGGLLPWARPAIDVVLRGQSLGSTSSAHHLVGPENLLRVDPAVPDKELRLDGFTPEQLRGRAESYSRKIAPRFQARFLDHLAGPYKPR